MNELDEIIFYKHKIDELEDQLLTLELENNTLKQKVKSHKFEDHTLNEIRRLAKVSGWELDNLTYTFKMSDDLSLLLGRDPSSKEKISWRDFLEMIIDSDNQNIKNEIIENGIRKGKDLAFEHTFLKEDGKIIFVQHHCKTFYNAIGQPLKTVGLILDITKITKSQLELKISNEENRKKDIQLVQQSRLAQLGEMISMIAHQWRQPLTAISMQASNILIDAQLGIINNESLEKEVNGIQEKTQHLSKTIEDFRNFYKEDKKSVKIKLENIILTSLNIIKASLLNENIKIIEEYYSKEDIELYDNEIMHVVLNILKNTQDKVKEKQIKNPYLKITTENRTISICDNAGGIPEDIIEKIFDPYFSTKDLKNGTGLGLYMSKIIVENHHRGKLSVKNTDEGVCFIIELGIISSK
ncbi:MAG: HAMP domain-containing sensor histidine kinase [Halarcobacter sp.]